MKNKILALGLIALSIISCTKDDIQPIKGIAKASLEVGLKTENTTTGKSVNRGDIPAWVKDINITATSLEQTYSVSNLFDLVANGGESEFKLDNIAVGHNKIDITTTCSSYPRLMTDWTQSGDATSFINYLKALNPYATYSATINDFNIVQGAPNKLENVELTTKNGRIIAVFQLSETLKQLGIYALVTPIIDGVPMTNLNFKVGEYNFNREFYWSDANAIEGKTVGFSWQFYEQSNNILFNQQIFSTQNNLITVVASKSLNKIFTIDNQNLTTNQTSQTSFTTQTWVDDLESGTIE